MRYTSIECLELMAALAEARGNANKEIHTVIASNCAQKLNTPPANVEFVRNNDPSSS